MQRLTNDKKTSQMTMSELAFNCCYAKDGEAWYRDYDTNIQAREFVRNLYKHYTGLDLPKDNEEFDEMLLDDLFNEPDMAEGLLALFYRNLWGMAELRERLKEYEDLEEQGLLLRLPCKVGDALYHILACTTAEDFGKKYIGWFIVTNITIDTTKEVTIMGRDMCNREWGINSRGIGKTVFLTKEEALAKLREMEAGE